jgi:hypothetical protein
MILLPLLLQVTPVQPIVKGTALPPPGTEEAAVMAPVNAILDAIRTDDGAAILAASRPEGGLTAAFDAGGTRRVSRISWAEFAASLKPGGDHYEERLFDPAIEVDGDVGFVWARFTVLKNGTPHHCGYDLFDVVRENGSWKVLNVTWSQRTTGCAA